VTRLLLVGLLGAALAAVAPKPGAARSPEEAQGLVERAAEYVRVHGRTQALADFSRPDGGFVDGELYIFCIDGSGIQVANGGNPKLVGKSVFAVRSADGKLPSLEIYRIGQADGQGWFAYLWPNLLAHSIQRKVSYFRRIDDQTVCGSGYFVPDQR
jgi:signal transduction histidine kinase